MSETSGDPLKKILAFSAVVEIGTALVLMIDPAIVVRWLLGAEVSGVGTLLGRCFGIALLALGVACWPGGPRASPRSPVSSTTSSATNLSGSRGESTSRGTG